MSTPSTNNVLANQLAAYGFQRRTSFACFLAAGALMLTAFSSAIGQPAAEPTTTSAEPAKQTAAPVSDAVDSLTPAEGTSRRVGGKLEAKLTRPNEGVFAFERCLIDTPLPVGYPDPTPPGAIDIKTYPSVRRAEYRSSMSPDIGSNIGFFPLFNHIKRRDIAMTSPVEMNYSGINWTPPEGGDVKPASWTMSFLYRKVEQGPAGDDSKDGRITVVDTKPVTVVSLGCRGGYGFQAARKRMQELSQWLDSNPTWERVGEPRVFHYNGPDRANADKWSEVQWPVQLKSTVDNPVLVPVIPNSSGESNPGNVRTTPDSIRTIPSNEPMPSPGG